MDGILAYLNSTIILWLECAGTGMCLRVHDRILDRESMNLREMSCAKSENEDWVLSSALPLLPFFIAAL